MWGAIALLPMVLESVGFPGRGGSMTTYVHYDLTGTIQSFIAADVPEGVAGGLVPEAGTFVDSIEDLRLRHDETDVDTVTEIARTHRVEVSPPAPRKLVRK
jgi:hypothetical protein